MSEPSRPRGVNVGLLIVLVLVGLIFLFWGTRWIGHFWWPSGRSWSFGLFGPLYGLLGIWGLIAAVLAVWVGVDANRRGLNGLLWGLLVFFTHIVGLIVYLIVAPTLAGQRNGAVKSSPASAAAVAGPAATGACCRNCRAELGADFKVCPHCGTAVGPPCSRCGRSLQQEWTVCPYCGAGAGTQGS